MGRAACSTSPDLSDGTLGSGCCISQCDRLPEGQEGGGLKMVDVMPSGDKTQGPICRTCDPRASGEKESAPSSGIHPACERERRFLSWVAHMGDWRGGRPMLVCSEQCQWTDGDWAWASSWPFSADQVSPAQRFAK
ncbi:hypothetical protein NDU88_000774 [Pleurodeles waltl]|uniref:Uncharacterized protein n=1 Tax=Pleurodeles waltl TaxID=8319 RepID=A0AAV7URF5_PLEWA|nr:hypothetical protein NDU88_000774 [Pleurodeles waltl]